MECNNVYLGNRRECLLGDPTCETHYDFAGANLENLGLGENRLNICWYDSWYDKENNREVARWADGIERVHEFSAGQFRRPEPRRRALAYL